MEIFCVLVSMVKPQGSRPLFPPHLSSFKQIIKLFFVVSNLIIHIIIHMMVIKVVKVLLDNFYLFGDVPKSFSSPGVKSVKGSLKL
jgi:hypothetical protein